MIKAHAHGFRSETATSDQAAQQSQLLPVERKHSGVVFQQPFCSIEIHALNRLTNARAYFNYQNDGHVNHWINLDPLVNCLDNEGAGSWQEAS